MSQKLRKELAALQGMTPQQLRERYAEVFGEGTRTGNRTHLVKRIAWRLQALAEGDLSERARRRAAELAKDADVRLTAPPPKKPEPVPARLDGNGRLPPPGTVITRPYKGRTVQVTVTPTGFECNGEVYRSLSAAAKAITGSHCSGYTFFKVGKKTL